MTAIHRRPALAMLALAGALALPALAGDDAELRSLREENRQLRQQLEALRVQCPASPLAAQPAAPDHVASETPAVPSPPSMAAPPAMPPPAPAPPPVAAAAPAASTSAGTAASDAASLAPAAAAPPGYKLVKIEPVEPFSDTGCKAALRANPTAPWRLRENWDDLHAGMSMAEVEALLGPEHHDARGGDRIGWEYGRCGVAVRASVVFGDGRVLYWKRPIF